MIFEQFLYNVNSYIFLIRINDVSSWYSDTITAVGVKQCYYQNDLSPYNVVRAASRNSKTFRYLKITYVLRNCITFEYA